MKSRRLSIVRMLVLPIMIVAMVTLFFGGCEAEGEKTLKIGYIGALQTAPGLDGQRDIELSADLDNEAGGMVVGGDKYNVQIISYDSGGNQSQAVAAANKLIFEDKVKFILYDTMSVPTAWLPIADENKVLTAGAAFDMSELSPDLHYSCCIWALHTTQIIQTAWFIKNRPDMVENVVFATTDDQVGHMNEVVVGGVWEQYGVETTWIYFPPDATDLSSVATKVKTLNPTAFCPATGNPPVDGALIKAVWQAGCETQFFGGGGMPLLLMATVCPIEALEGYIDWAAPKEFDPPATEMAKDWLDAWTAKYGEWEGQDHFDAMYAGLKAAIQEAGSLDVDEVATAIFDGLKFDCASGTFQMITRPDLGNNRTVDSVRTVFLKQIVNGKAELMATISVEEALSFFQEIIPVETQSASEELDYYK